MDRNRIWLSVKRERGGGGGGGGAYIPYNFQENLPSYKLLIFLKLFFWLDVAPSVDSISTLHKKHNRKQQYLERTDH